MQNRKYTWSNGQRQRTLVHLDRVFCNKEWDDLFTNYSLQALSSSLSDHCPLLCKLNQPHTMARFRFEVFWTKVPGFLEVVQEAWSLPVRGTSPLMVFHNRLENTRIMLGKWSKELFSEARLQLHMANEVIQRLDKLKHGNPESSRWQSLNCTKISNIASWDGQQLRGHAADRALGLLI